MPIWRFFSQYQGLSSSLKVCVLLLCLNVSLHANTQTPSSSQAPMAPQPPLMQHRAHKINVPLALPAPPVNFEDSQTMPEDPALQQSWLMKQLDPGRYSLSQRLTQAVGPALIGSIMTFPIYAIKMDRQNKEKMLSLKPRNLFRGLSAAVGKNLPANAVLMISNQVLLLGKDRDEVSIPHVILAAGASGFLSGVMATPIDLLVTRQRHHRLEPLEAVKKLYKEGGLRSLKHGWQAVVARDVLSGIGLFAVPNLFEMVLPQSEEHARLQRIATVAASGAIVGLLSLPFDSVRAPMQKGPIRPKKNVKVMGLVDNIKFLMRHDPRDLLNGGGWRAFQLATSFVILDTARDLFQQYHKKNNITKGLSIEERLAQVKQVQLQMKERDIRRERLQRKVDARRQEIPVLAQVAKRQQQKQMQRSF